MPVEHLPFVAATFPLFPGIPALVEERDEPEVVWAMPEEGALTGIGTVCEVGPAFDTPMGRRSPVLPVSRCRWTRSGEGRVEVERIEVPALHADELHVLQAYLMACLPEEHDPVDLLELVASDDAGWLADLAAFRLLLGDPEQDRAYLHAVDPRERLDHVLAVLDVPWVDPPEGPWMEALEARAVGLEGDLADRVGALATACWDERPPDVDEATFAIGIGRAAR